MAIIGALGKEVICRPILLYLPSQVRSFSDCYPVMAFFSAGFGLLLHFLFWGAGLALLSTPRRWRVGWPALCAPFGLALQSAVVWFGALTPLPGTQVYGKWSLLIPIVLLFAGCWRAVRVERRSLWVELREWQSVGLLMAVILNVLLIPFASASKVLTSASLGSCDAADYAAGARTLLEFARWDRTGFMGLTEVVQLHSVDNFFDHWIRLNHFTPSALVALNAAIFSYQPYEIISVTTAVFVALSLPTVFWLARSTFRYSPLASFWIATVYGLSPLLWYAAYHVAMSQLLAAMAIAVVNGAAISVWAEGATWRRGLGWFGVLAAGFWLILGAYNFIVVVCLVPALGYVGTCALWHKEGSRFGRWIALVLGPLVLTGAVFTQRTLGLVERFLLFQQYDFGWKIPALSPEGWLGMVGSTSLAALPGILRWSLTFVVVLLWAAGLLWASRRKDAKAWLATCATFPILLGYGFLELRAVLRGTNASYDAYKLISVFYPGLLAGVAYWLNLARSPQRWIKAGIVTFALLVLGFNAYSAHRFMRRMQSPPLLVDQALVQLQRLETLPQVTSVNLRIGDFWARLWANSFLLRKPQYFPSHTYEGRRNTELKGEWDLLGGIISLRTPDLPEELRLSAPYSLVDTRSSYFLKVQAGEGWYDQEVIAKAGAHWRWSQGDATLVVENPQSRRMWVNLRGSLRSLNERDLEVWINGERMRSVRVGTQLRTIHVPRIALPPGRSIIEFRSLTPPLSPGPHDGRKLSFAAYGLEIDVLKDSDTPGS